MIHYDTRKINKNDVFLAIPKAEIFITKDLIEKTKKIIKIKKENIYSYLSQLWEIDIDKIKIIGITGTNGKTTTTYLVEEVLKKAKFKPRVIGTINNSLTTPEMFDLLTIIKEMIINKETHLVMEVSSIGIAEQRIEGLPFMVKLLTNITQDHLDYHLTFKNYVQSKFKFLENEREKVIFPTDYKKTSINFKHNLIGKFNENNLKAAYSICQKLNIHQEIIEKALSSALAPKGRFQKIDINKPYTVIVDYAHTPDSLDNVLKEAKYLTQGNLIVVFGAGGNRDGKKRPIMGRIAEKWADIIIITSDNPREEDPLKIINDIIAGISDREKIIVEENRKKAIKIALEKAQKNDFILIAGKGHENYQIIGKETFHFDDEEVVQEIIKCTP
jgi:UDP-N-acetylmuramoyl-L-alanyl-D-glutamate--2,6-diaminopimelate ligase